ncbi:MAG: patatin-like phospholipase family protein [Beijerinckiaceae bacterium]|nr:patatin-like phospholipase family protein [Beijerinckiaceae bacterium]
MPGQSDVVDGQSIPGSGAREPLLVDLALQGGGSHGAFTWGVLDRLLEEPWLEVDGVSGTSAGAMNAAVFAYGMLTGGPLAAKAALESFWRKVSAAAAFSPFQRTPLDMMLGRWSLDYSPNYVAANLMARLVSPYSLGGGGANPLRDILIDCVDFDRLAESRIRIFITATNVRTGRGRIFRNGEITPDVLLASACLPTMFKAVMIDGEGYWDGGYSGNPTITPLVQECQSHDTLIVQINPVVRDEIPESAADIHNRINEVSFNATLLKELKMISLLRQVCDASDGEGWQWAQMRLHLINSDMMRDLGASSKLNAEWAFLTMLRDEGRRAASEFIARHATRIGVESTFDFESVL